MKQGGVGVPKLVYPDLLESAHHIYGGAPEERYLQRFRKVNQHHPVLIVHPTGDVETHGGYMIDLAPLNEVDTDGELVQPLCSLFVSVTKPQAISYLLDGSVP